MGLLLLYTITSAVLAPFFSQPRHPTVLLSDPADSFTKYTAQPGVRRSYKFDAIARLCKLLFTIVAVFGRAEPAFTLPVALCGNALLAVLARTRGRRPTRRRGPTKRPRSPAASRRGRPKLAGARGRGARRSERRRQSGRLSGKKTFAGAGQTCSRRGKRGR